jgi:sulfonate transport system substrate-binding protein
VLDDPAKAAAIAAYVGIWAKATQWINDNPEAWIEGYYVKDQGLSAEDGHYLVELTGNQIVPDSWDEVVGRHQHTIDILAAELGYAPFSAEEIFDRRFEALGAAALAQ